MFDSLSERLERTIKNLRGLGRISEKNIQTTLREIRVNLLEADVALPVALSFIEKTKEKALDTHVLNSLQPGQAFIRVIRDELTTLLGSETSELNFQAAPPVVILLAGLQGSGKTTTAAKLANWIQNTQNKKVMLTSTDVYRAAAIQQLETLSHTVNAAFFPSNSQQKPHDIAKNALKAAKNELCDVLIIDTAGRLHIDDAMMDEIKTIHAVTAPTETLFVVDSMTGQDAANTAKAFNDALPLSGVILTKVDGDARGGAALSIRQITGKAIKFIGVGEKIEALEPFHPDRIASRILGMGDVLSLIEDVEKTSDKKAQKKIQKKLRKGSFDLNDFRDQLKQINKLGGIAKLAQKIPGISGIPKQATDMEGKFKQIEAIINSMTEKERCFPAVIKGSRKQRIAKGSGTNLPAINRLLKQFSQMQKMMKKVSQKGGMSKMMRQMSGGGMSDMLGGMSQGLNMNQLQGMIPPEMQGGLKDLINDKNKE